MLTSLSQPFHRCSPDEYEKNWAYNNFLSQRALQQADNVRSQLKRSMEKHDLDLVSTPFEDKSYYVNIRKALTAGFFMQVAHREGGKGEYVTIKDNQVVRIHKGSGLETTPDWVCFNEFVLTTSNVGLIPSPFPCLIPVRHFTLDLTSTDSPSSFCSPRSVHPDRHRDPARVATRSRAAVLQPRHVQGRRDQDGLAEGHQPPVGEGRPQGRRRRSWRWGGGEEEEEGKVLSWTWGSFFHLLADRGLLDGFSPLLA